MNKILLVAAIILAVGILGYLGSQSSDKFEHRGIMDKLHGYEGGALMADKMFDTAQFVRVHAKIPGVAPFFTESRTGALLSFPCGHCHSVPLSQLSSWGDQQVQKAHWDIHLKHAGAPVMDCFTCHNRHNLDELISLAGHSISFDRVFEMCGQCHTQAYRDWQGGAHGKSLLGWRQPRVAKTCVSCHNPHQPAIEPRWPSRLVERE
jgi:hypothetical protein